MLLTTSLLSQCFCIFPENSSNTGNSLLIFRKFYSAAVSTVRLEKL